MGAAVVALGPEVHLALGQHVEPVGGGALAGDDVAPGEGRGDQVLGQLPELFVFQGMEDVDALERDDVAVGGLDALHAEERLADDALVRAVARGAHGALPASAASTASNCSSATPR